jgi:5-(carboxyamino)imidazole ribonucleotide synthase
MTSEKAFLPGTKIGVMGGGQLGRMFAIAARRMGYHVHTFSPDKNGPAAQFSDRATAASYADEAAVRRFSRSIDLLTFEFENIPAATIEWASGKRIVRPRGEIILIAQNRLREKEFLSGAGFPVAPFRKVSSLGELTKAAEEVGRPAILKGGAFGYDGKGQERIDPEMDLATVWSGRDDEICVLERVIEFEKEISVIVARAPGGATAVFPVCENIHRNHILDLTIAPARIIDSVADAARELACAVALRFDLVGLLAVEMFLQSNGELIINEVAPRPHNSGHWTIEGCATSQFEQHVRAVCGLPLGASDLLAPTAMVNLLGEIWSEGEPDWNAALAEPNVHLHLYGKRQPRPGRKMGHLTATGENVEAAAASALRAREKLIRTQ